MQNHKKFLRHWQQHTTQLSSNYHGNGSPETNLLSGASSKKYDKLRKKLFEMKHRVCLLEFGLGSVANLLQNSNSFNSPHSGSNIQWIEGAFAQSSATRLSEEADSAKYKETLKGIGEILLDIESCMNTSRAEPNMASVQSEVDITNQVCKRKTQIYIEGTRPQECSRKNTEPTVDVCNIQVLENPAMFHSPPTPSTFYQQTHQQHYTNINESSSYQYHSEFYHNPVTTPGSNMPSSSSPFDALSTLASVATSKHTEKEMMKVVSKQELVTGSFDQHNKGNYANRSVADVMMLSEKTEGHQLVNPFIFSENEEESNSMPLKKRRCPSTINIISSLAGSNNENISCGGRDGKSTRRSMRRCYQK